MCDTVLDRVLFLLHFATCDATGPASEHFTSGDAVEHEQRRSWLAWQLPDKPMELWARFDLEAPSRMVQLRVRPGWHAAACGPAEPTTYPTKALLQVS